MKEDLTMKSNNWYIQLPNNFYELPIHTVIQNQENGQHYINLYLRLLLLSVSHSGYLLIVDEVPYDEETIANLTKFELSLVKDAIKQFMKFGLISKENNTFYMTQFENYVKTTSTDRVRKYREKAKKQEKSNDETYMKHDETLHSVTSNTDETLLKQECNAQSKNKNKSKNNNKNYNAPSITPPGEKRVSSTKSKSILSFPTEDEFFNEFWESYPKKSNIAKAYKTFKELNIDRKLLLQILETVEKQKTSVEWGRESGRYIPTPYKYLGESRWNDVLNYNHDKNAEPDYMDDFMKKIADMEV
jgi:predicted phage replisome organizer